MTKQAERRHEPHRVRTWSRIERHSHRCSSSPTASCILRLPALRLHLLLLPRHLLRLALRHRSCGHQVQGHRRRFPRGRRARRRARGSRAAGRAFVVLFVGGRERDRVRVRHLRDVCQASLDLLELGGKGILSRPRNARAVQRGLERCLGRLRTSAQRSRVSSRRTR